MICLMCAFMPLKQVPLGGMTPWIVPISTYSIKINIFRRCKKVVHWCHESTAEWRSAQCLPMWLTDSIDTWTAAFPGDMANLWGYSIITCVDFSMQIIFHNCTSTNNNIRCWSWVWWKQPDNKLILLPHSSCEGNVECGINPQWNQFPFSGQRNMDSR